MKSSLHNSQTAVKEEELRDKIPKELEMYYESLDDKNKQIFHEKIKKQFANDKKIKTAR